MIGYFLATPPAKKPRLLLLMAAGALPAFVLSGLVGVIRGEIGRGGIELLTADRIETMIERASNLLDTAGGHGTDEVGLNGIGRMVVWPNLTVPMMTPDPVPYRGLSTFPSEVDPQQG
jgi:hypothetical protein